MSKLIYGVGVNDADYAVNGTISDTGERTRCVYYTQWKNMVARCYGKSTHKRQPSYVGCSVHPDWHSFMSFRSWMEKQDWKGKALDKDYKVEGNRVYGPDTCTWLTRLQNSKCKPNSLFAVYKGFWVSVVEFCGEDIALYSYLTKSLRLDKRAKIEDLIELRYKPEDLGIQVEWEGELRYLKELCIEYGRDYSDVMSRLKTWKNTSLYACLIYEKSYSWKYDMGNGSTKMVFKDRQAVYIHLDMGCSVNRFDTYFKMNRGDLGSLKADILSHVEYDPTTYVEIHGVTKSRQEWISWYETSASRVADNIQKYKVPFKEAVQLPVMVVKRLLVNGEKMKVRNFWELYNLDPKAANTIKSQRGKTYIEMLEYYGKDVTGVSVSVL